MQFEIIKKNPGINFNSGFRKTSQGYMYCLLHVLKVEIRGYKVGSETSGTISVKIGGK